jgi:hypothetical protein
MRPFALAARVRIAYFWIRKRRVVEEAEPGLAIASHHVPNQPARTLIMVVPYSVESTLQ